MTENRPTWADWAFVLHNAHDPLEDVTGHFTSGPDGLLTFHPWDISYEAHEERRAAGPGTMPSPHEFDMAAIREKGRQARERVDAMILAAFLGDTEAAPPASEIRP